MRNKESFFVMHECDGCCCKKPWWNLFRCIYKDKSVEFKPGEMNYDGTDGQTTFHD